MHEQIITIYCLCADFPTLYGQDKLGPDEHRRSHDPHWSPPGSFTGIKSGLACF